MGLSRRAYAAHRKAKGLTGGTDRAVRNAIAAGRIDIEPDGTIDPGKADAQWAETTDTTRAKPKAPAPKAAASPAPEPKPLSKPTQVEQAETGGMTMARAATADRAYSARIKELKLKQLSKELVDRKAATAHVYDLARKDRDTWLQFPARKAALMAAELGVDAHAMEQALDRYIRDHLAELPEIKVDLGFT